MSTLSEDIIIAHVLTRLPVESLIRFRHVCKSWLYILSNPDPHFITSHLNHTSQNPEYECLLMTMHNYECHRSDHYYNHVDIMSRTRFSYTHMDNTPLYVRIVGSINGLVCLIIPDHRFLLWNPVTGLGKTISPPQYYMGKKWFHEKLCGFGLDYHVQGEEVEFKIVVCYYDSHEDNKLLQGFVYTCNSDSWNGLVIPDFVSCTHIHFKGHHDDRDIIVEGCPYWVARGGLYSYVVKFESGSNQFKKFLLPTLNPYTCHNYILANLKDCPTMMVYYLGPEKLFDVFQLDEECDVWSKTYTFGPIYCSPGMLSQCFKYGGEIVFNNGKMLYDPKTKGIKVIGNGYWKFVSGCSYTPSLVFLHGMEHLHTQSHWRSHEVEVWRPESHLSLVFSRLLECLGWNGGQMLLDCLGWRDWD